MNEFMTDEEQIYISAVRYGIGRKTYITSVIANFMMKQELSEKCKFIMIRDIENERDSKLSDKPLGDECDKKSWLALLEYLKK